MEKNHQTELLKLTATKATTTTTTTTTTAINQNEELTSVQSFPTKEEKESVASKSGLKTTDKEFIIPIPPISKKIYQNVIHLPKKQKMDNTSIRNGGSDFYSGGVFFGGMPIIFSLTNNDDDDHHHDQNKQLNPISTNKMINNGINKNQNNITATMKESMLSPPKREDDCDEETKKNKHHPPPNQQQESQNNKKTTTATQHKHQYNPQVPMSKEELTAWRKEARRVRNRQSAAASRRKVRNQILDLQKEVEQWKSKYEHAMERIQLLEESSDDNDDKNNNDNGTI